MAPTLGGTPERVLGVRQGQTPMAWHARARQAGGTTHSSPDDRPILWFLMPSDDSAIALANRPHPGA